MQTIKKLTPKTITVQIFAVIIAANLISTTNTVKATVLFNDGATHVVDYTINDYVQVSTASGNATTTHLILTNGGNIKYLQSLNNSLTTITGGSVQDEIRVYSGAQLTMSGGIIPNLGCYGGQTTLNGGTVQHEVNVLNNGRLIIDGKNFRINGRQMTPGEYHKEDLGLTGNSQWNQHSSGTITATLLNGDQLSCNYGVYNDGCLVLVPEPSSILLFSMAFAFIILIRKFRSFGLHEN